MGHTWVYPIRIPLYLLVFGTTWVTPNPKKSRSKPKDDKISSIVAPAAGPAASIRPPGPHPPWTRTDWCCRPHRGPRELQSWRVHGDRDPCATPSMRRVAAFAALAAPKRVAFLYYAFDCCAHCRRARVAGTVHPSVRLNPPSLGST